MSTTTIVIKIGTHVATDNGQLDRNRLAALCTDIGRLMDDGVAAVLVSSGAVAAGMHAAENNAKKDEVEHRQVCSAVGQVALMQVYSELFASQGRRCAQVLATRSDFRDRQHYLNMQRCLKALLVRGVVPVVNENDVVSVTELMFTDNDELAGLLAAMLGADRLFLLSNIPGILDAKRQVIADWDDNNAPQLAGIEGSSFGRGGIHTKLRVARRAAGLGIETIVADGRVAGLVPELMAGAKSGTRFPSTHSASGVKRWVASSRGHEKGVVTINEGAARALRDTTRLTSLLPVGITDIGGEFGKGELIRIQATDGELIGWGRAQCGSEAARSHLGRRGARALVHYDYLYIEPT